jgi:UDP-N-acetylmuramyl pentapeptide phosphotransferase/UDP-N-acetylglucosamine-1-phosphate transferase/glycosyltransferase involved in cell wall biosynthesis
MIVPREPHMTHLSAALVTCAASAATAAVLTPLVAQAARHLHLMDTPGLRKVHRVPVPRVGGVAIAVAALVPVVVTLLVARPELLSALSSAERGRLVTLLVGAIVVLAVGLIDDVWQVSAKYKLVALIVASIGLCASGAVVRQVVISNHTWVELGLAAWPVTLLWLVGVTVSINFIDGLDGLAAGIVALGAGVLVIGAGAGFDQLTVVIGVGLVGALAGFLIYNRNPARIFMGDCGSMFIGFLLAGTCVVTEPAVGTTRAILLPALALIVPLFDTFFTLIRRGVLQRRSLFAAEGGHIHHRLLDAGLSHRQVVWLLHGVTLVASVVAVICVMGAPVPALLSAVVLCFTMVGLNKTAGTVRARETIGAVRRNRAIGRETRRYQHAFYDLQLRFREAKTVDMWWLQLCRAAEVLDFGKLDVTMGRREGPPLVRRWRRTRDDVDPAAAALAAADSITADVPVPQRRAGTSVRAEVEVLASAFLETGGLRVALFARLMADYGLDRLPLHATPERDGVAPALPAGDVTTYAAAPVDVGPFAGLRVAVVHDFLYTYGGAERVLEQMLTVFPQADVFALFDFVPDAERGFLRGRPVTPSFLQRIPGAKQRHRLFLPLMPLAVEQLDVSDYDLVLSSSYVAAKGVITRPDQLHVCYCHTPVRFAWDLQKQYLQRAGLAAGLLSLPAKVLLHYIRSWDVHSAQGVDVFLSNSDFVGRRIAKTYRRVATTIYPPVDTESFSLHTTKEDYYLTASRLVPYKRIDVIVEAFASMPNRRLLVVGDGPERDKLRALAGPNVTFLGHEPAAALRRHLQLARAFVFAAEEDFGIAPVEAQACGTPVIAFGRGGATETVIAGQTGLFFDAQTPAAIVAAVERFEQQPPLDPAACRSNAERFTPEKFRQHLTDHVLRHWKSFKTEKLSASSAALGLSELPVDVDGLSARSARGDVFE